MNHTADKEQLLLRKEQVYLLYKPSLTAAVVTLFAAGFLGYIQWGLISSDLLMIWFSIITIVISVRIAYYIAFTRRKPSAIDIPFWEKSYIGLSIAAGLSWGYAGVFLLPSDNFAYQAATITMVVGMTSGATNTLSALRLPVFIFLYLSLIPLIVHLFLKTSHLSVSFAVMCSVYLFFLTSTANHIYLTHYQNILMRLQGLAREKSLQKSEQFVRKTADVLEFIAIGKPAAEIYNKIAHLYESRHTGLRCSMLELHGNKLIHGGAPSLPKAYCDAVNGLENGPSVGSCGTSTYTGKRVLVENIATDTKWQALKDLALANNLHCCWSEPIKNSTGKVLGAFGMYYDHPALPDADQLEDLQEAARLAGIVMEREYRESLLHKLHLAFDSAYDAIAIVDADIRIEYVNAAFEKMTGYSPQEAIGKYLNIIRSGTHPDSFYAKIKEATVRVGTWHGEMEIKHKNGSIIITERTVSTIFDESNDNLFRIIIQRDVTAYREMENKFHQAQKMEAIGTLVGGIAHDFNNILASISGNLYLAKAHIKEPKQVTQKLDRIELLSTRASNLIQQMLTFARKDSVSMKALSLNQLTEETFTFLHTTIPENIKLELNILHNDISIHGDNTQIQQVLMNLVNNARDALAQTNNPKISINVQIFYTDNAFIKNHSYFKHGDYAHISVQDNGSGISEEHIEHLFEPFFTTKEVGQGTGLGLAMVFGAVKRHQGYIEVDSTEGQGTTFNLYIPLLTAEPLLKATTQTPVQISQGNQELILLVDDEPLILEMGKEVLEDLGYQVLQASDGQEGIDVYKANKERIALIVTDVVMPRLGGIEMMACIHELQPDVKVIFSTGYERGIIIPENMGDQNQTLLHKPYDIEKLRILVAEKLSPNH